MTDALAAVLDLFLLIPRKLRQAIYGLYGLVILVDGTLHLLPTDVASKAMIGFGVFTSLMALANSRTKALPPPPPPLGPGVPENFPGEFA